MQVFKLIKSDFTNLEGLLKRTGLVKGNNAEPSRIFVSPEDYSKLAKNIEKQFKKEYPYLTKDKLKFATGTYLLNLGPVVTSAVRPGFAIVEKA